MSADAETIETVEQHTNNVVAHTPPMVSVSLEPEMVQYLNRLATRRSESGGNGSSWTEESDTEIHKQGIGGEAALHLAYGEYELDTRIISGGGDGGVDGMMDLPGEGMTEVDVKLSTYDDPWLRVESYIAEGDSGADVYILAKQDKNTVTLCGWVTAEQLMERGVYRQTRCPWANHMNYTIEDTDELNPMPTPTDWE